MNDYFPVPPIPALSRAVQPLADALGLNSLPMHIHQVATAALFYTFVQQAVSPVLSRRLFPTIYSRMPRAKKANWDVHVVSLVQSLLINTIALASMVLDPERRAMHNSWEERIWGYTPTCAMVQALASGYFVWDLVVTLLNFDVFGPGLLAHAVSALIVFSFGFRPFLNYYSSTFILYELSTPFLNMHWFFDKLNMTGSRAQLYNGIALIATFFSCRLVYGIYMSHWVYRDMWNAVRDGPSAAASASYPMRYARGAGPIPTWLFATYIGSNVVLNSLNVHWFFKMISAVRKRFEPGSQSKRANEAVSASPTVANATSTALDEKTATHRTTLDELAAAEPALSQTQKKRI